MKRLSRAHRQTFGIVLAAIALTSCDKPQSGSGSDVVPSLVQSTHEYELREKCARDSRDWFTQNYPRDMKAVPAGATANYENHFNAKANRCYLATTSGGEVTDAKSGETRATEQGSLQDVLDNRELGRYFLSYPSQRMAFCYVDESNCATKDEWLALTQKYMER